MILQQLMGCVKYGTLCRIIDVDTKDVIFNKTWGWGFYAETQFSERQLCAEIISISTRDGTLCIETLVGKDWTKNRACRKALGCKD